MKFAPVTAERWRTTEHIVATVRDLIVELAARHPVAASLAPIDPYAALAEIPDLNVVRDNTTRNPTCPIDGTYNAATATIRYRQTGNPARDHFTLLHELGHHLLAISDDWNYDVVPLLSEANVTRHVEERLVNAFASLVLIPDEKADQAFQRGVTATAARDLHLATEASATACLSRCLLEPGNRMAMLANGHGKVWYAQSNGEPYAPSADVEQPAIAHGALRALNGDGTARFSGHEGIRYRSGKTNPHVNWDMCLDNDLVFAIVEPARFDSRTHRSMPNEWSLTCLAGCGATFTLEESTGSCPKCREARCPRCRGCECPREAFCERCTLALPTARARTGARRCEDCE